MRCYWNFWSCLLIVTNKVIIWSASHSALCGTYILKQKKISQLDLSESGAYCSTSFWLKSNLENCTQMCSINGSHSKSCSLTCGVLQGRILGPLVFLSYINDLPICLSNCEPRMYTCLITPILHMQVHDNANNIQLHLNQDLENVLK